MFVNNIGGLGIKDVVNTHLGISVIPYLYDVEDVFIRCDIVEVSDSFMKVGVVRVVLEV